jgi:hypothetical protein
MFAVIFAIIMSIVMLCLIIRIYIYLTTTSITGTLGKNTALQMLKEIINTTGKDKSIYETLWKAEDWFDDPEVLKLCRAIEKQDIDTIEELIKSEIDVNVCGKENIPLLLWAYPSGEKVLDCLLSHGANPNFIIESNYKVQDRYLIPGNSLFGMAVQSNMENNPKFKNYVDVFLRYDIDVEAGFVPSIFYALKRGGNDDILKKIIEYGANLNSENCAYQFPITEAAFSRRYSGLLLLLESGATYDPTTIPGGTMQRILYKTYHEKMKLLTFEQQKELKKVIQWLEEHGVSFDKPIPPSESTRKPEPFRVTNPNG